MKKNYNILKPPINGNIQSENIFSSLTNSQYFYRFQGFINRAGLKMNSTCSVKGRGQKSSKDQSTDGMCATMLLNCGL